MWTPKQYYNIVSMGTPLSSTMLTMTAQLYKKETKFTHDSY